MAKALVRKAGSGQGRRRTRAGGHEQETPSTKVSALDFREILETVPAAVYATDAVGRITFYNDAAATLWGCRPELGESTFCGSWKLYWPDGTPMQHDECPMALALQQKQPVRGMEAIAERPDGTRVRFLPYPTPICDASGDLIGAVNLLVDTSERRRTEERIAASELRYRGIVENVRVAVFEEDFSAVLDMLDEIREQGVSDLRGYFRARPEQLAAAIRRVRVSDANNFAIELFEADRKETLLKSLGDIFLPETAAVFVEELLALWEGRRRFESEATQRTLSDRRLDVIFTMAFGGERCEHTLVSILDISARKAAERALLEERHRLETLNRIAKSVSGNFELEHMVQSVTDAATELSGAKFGAFFYNVIDEQGERYLLYTLSGAPRAAFEKFGIPRNTALFEATFRGAGIVRSDDIRTDPRYGRNPPHYGMPDGHLAVVSYLAVPVVSRSGEVHGGLFFGHDQPGVFTKESEDLVAGIATHAAIAIDNARLLRAAQAEIEQHRRAEQVERRLTAVVESCDDAIVSKDLNGIIRTWNRGAERLFGYTEEEVVGKPITILIPLDRQDEEPGILARIRRGERIDHYETVRQRKDGSLVETSLTVSPIEDADGTIVGASKVARDITERRRAEAHKDLLLNEMQHRIKNTLAMVQAVAMQTMRGAPGDELAMFVARLHALAGVHELLTCQDADRARVGEIVRRALKPFQEKHQEKFLIEGPEAASLDANRSVLLSMAVHELATNAVKYGALSNGSGQVRIAWQLRQDHGLKLRWQETGGPPVKPPQRKGFGSRLIESALRGELGSARLEFAPEGVTCILEIAG
jgi:PAS domain S-box-containing protein